MSNPANPLSKFNSYAYQHVLIACSNNDVATALSEVTDITEFERTTTRGKYAPVEIGQLGKFIVLINSTQDAEFFIDSASWGSIFIPAGTTESTYDFNSAEVDGEMKVIEPNGMRFINVLAETASRLNIAVPAMAFLLKTIFVGQNGQGHAETISGIRPLVFTMVDLTADFDYTGATYNISLVGGRDGYAKHPGISHIVGGKTLNIAKDATIADALKGLEQKANDVYKERKEKVVEQRVKSINAAGPTQETYTEGKDFIPVRYVVEFDDAFNNYKAATNDPESTSNKDGGHTVSFQPDLSVHASITRIMETSKQLMDHTSTGYEHDGKNRKFTFKINDEVHITKDEMLVTFNVKYYELTTTLQDPNVELGQDALPPADHVITFDYVYTGKNVDILDFRMEMDLALSYFMTLQSNRPLDSGQAETLSGSKTDDKAGNSDQIEGAGSNTSFGQNLRAPLLIGPQLLNNATKKVNVLETANARSVLASFAQMSTIGVKLKIAGNPLLLEEILEPLKGGGQSSVPREVSADNPLAQRLSTDWSNIPGYCKINIMMPTDPNDPRQYEPFWYEGYYRINSVEHEFDNGEFTQTLELYSMPVSTSFRDHTSTTGVSPTAKATKTPASEIPIVPSSTTFTATNIPSVLYSDYDDLIVAAATKHKVDPMIMRGLFKQESNFNPSAVNKYSKATGMGQLMIGAASDVGVKTAVYSDNTPIPGQDDRLDAAKNIEGSTDYLARQYRATGSYPEALAAYNTGLGNLRKYGYATVTSASWNGDGETGNYVKKILGYVALAQPTTSPIPENATGKDVGKMSAKEMIEGVTQGTLPTVEGASSTVAGILPNVR